MNHPAPARNLPKPLLPDASPMDIAGCTALSVERRRSLLEEWLADEMAIARAAGEGMETGPSPHMGSIQKALEMLARERDA